MAGLQKPFGTLAKAHLVLLLELPPPLFKEEILLFEVSLCDEAHHWRVAGEAAEDEANFRHIPA